MSSRSSTPSSPDPPTAAAVIVAGGTGRRFGGVAGAPRKQYVEILGVPVLLRALRPFLDHPRIGWTAVVLPEEDLRAPPSWLARPELTLLAGGAERADSVWNGLRAVPAHTDIVLVHDGARPFVSRDVIDRVLQHAAAGGAVPALPATDTIKEVDSEGVVTRTPDRDSLWHAQTPQGFPTGALIAAYTAARSGGWRITDDASVCERMGLPVRVVEGAPENIKITRPFDLRVATLLARSLLAS